MKLSIIIPVFNEGKTVMELLDRVWNAPTPGFKKELVIVESNSTDRSREIIQQFFKEKSAESPEVIQLILQPQPRGKGAAVREGFAAATGDVLLIQDADLEYDVSDYSSLLQPILEGKTNFVLGSRHLAAGGWKIRRFEKNPWKALFLNMGGIFFHSLFNLLYWQKLTDPTTMYKVFRKECLKDFMLSCNRFDFDFELLAKLIRSGHSPLEIPVSYTSRNFSEGKKVRILRDPITWIIAILRFRLSPLTTKPESVSAIPGQIL